MLTSIPSLTHDSFKAREILATTAERGMRLAWHETTQNGTPNPGLSLTFLRRLAARNRAGGSSRRRSVRCLFVGLYLLNNEQASGHHVHQSLAIDSQGEEERDHGARIVGLRQGLLLGIGLSEPEAGREGRRHHRGRERHRQGDRRRVRQERREGGHRGRPGRPRPRGRRGARRPGRRVLHPLRRDRRGAGGRGRGPRGGPPRAAGRHVQQRRHRGLPRASAAGRGGPRRLRPGDGDQRPGRADWAQARGARHGPAPPRQHHLHRERRRRGGHRGHPCVQRLQGGGARPRPRRGGGDGALRGASERRLPLRHPDAAGYGDLRGVAPREERRGNQADHRGGHGRGGRGGAGGGGHREGGAVPGVRRGQVRERAQPRRRRRLDGGQERQVEMPAPPCRQGGKGRRADGCRGLFSE